MNVLLIEDDAISRAVISLLLRAEGHSVQETENGASALQQILSQNYCPDIILADLQMPGLCGMDLAATLRPIAPHCRLLAMSATPNEADGYNGFLQKPLNQETLRAALAGQKTVVDSARVNLPILDEEVTEKLHNMMPATSVEEIFEVFVQDTHKRIAEMRGAAKRGEVQIILSIAHIVKGSAGMVGAKKMAAAAAEIEQGKYREADLPQLMENLLRCCEEVQNILLSKRKL